jgi:excisionase family DNA binding protein
MVEKQKYERDAYSVAELHEITGFARQTLYDAIERGEIPSIRVGTAIRVPGYWLRQQFSMDTTKP